MIKDKLNLKFNEEGEDARVYCFNNKTGNSMDIRIQDAIRVNTPENRYYASTVRCGVSYYGWGATPIDAIASLYRQNCGLKFNETEWAIYQKFDEES